ncbi:MAG: Nudix family hydrolase [Gammaproteobacteria bacterium]|nr:Nudix family hydrolase [Gammaproteobacteria bacterium]MBT8134273.1 Nudix family hydrolase [Gammaproteobacteria bacterium]NNJ50622.1 Nudix family hydrolase [Gammaproteobacteria bacterium]
MPSIIHVAVAVIVNDQGDVCISLRHKNTHQGGLWEFPGGKIEQHESVQQALIREIKEELDLEINDSRPLIKIVHDYQDKKVCLHVHRVLGYTGQAKGVEGQEVEWVAVDQLSIYEFPQANLPIIKAVQLPDRYLITGKFSDQDDFLKKLKSALDKGIELVQLRCKGDNLSSEELSSLIDKSSALCAQVNARLLLNIPKDRLAAIDLSTLVFDGFHADSQMLNTLSSRPEGVLFSASCHDQGELHRARQLGADFVVLSPVQKTASHPEAEAMGWQQFAGLVAGCTMPVYALGGVSEEDIKTAWSHGAQGIAAISAFWQ